MMIVRSGHKALSVCGQHNVGVYPGVKGPVCLTK